MKPESLLFAFARALDDILGRLAMQECADQAHPGSIAAIAIAYSGGLDSSVLLHLAHQYALDKKIGLFAFHIHHGISPNADGWLSHCERECARLAIGFDAHRIQLEDSAASGIEEAARIGRYAGLGQLCRRHHIPLLLTAHHLDDQAETVLLQLLRGSGIAGICGMEQANGAPELLGGPSPVMARPLLAISRQELEAYVDGNAIAHIEDESNLDPRYTRNALRQLIMPRLAENFPGFQQRFARTAQHAQAAQRLLNKLAEQDLAVCQNGVCLDTEQLKQLSPDRGNNLLRYWFAKHGLRMPSSAWLVEMRRQLLEAKADAQLCVTHPECHVRRYRDKLYLTPKSARQEAEADDASAAQQLFRWDGAPQLRFAVFDGVLYFDTAAPAEPGIDADWLRGQDLRIHYREGGERLKLAANRPSKNLKHHYQVLDVPSWERETLPIVSASAQLLFAAGIGMDCGRFCATSNLRIRLRWQPDAERTIRMIC